MATGKSRVLRSLFPRVLWDQRLTLNTPLNKLPLDASLLFELYGTVTVKREHSDTEMEKEQELGWQLLLEPFQ